MTHTDVVLTDNGGVVVPVADSVRVAAGDTIAFATANGRAAFAFFSPDAASVLSPKPANPCPIAAGGKAQFSFTSSEPGAYSAYFGYAETDGPSAFPGGHSQMLGLEINSSDAQPFSGPADTVGTGHGGR
jgi:hypothetical protein